MSAKMFINVLWIPITHSLGRHFRSLQFDLISLSCSISNSHSVEQAIMVSEFSFNLQHLQVFLLDMISIANEFFVFL